MAKAIEMIVSGLKCDAEGCGYENPDVNCEGYRSWLNAPCPRCGASLLTEKDLEATEQLMAFAREINKIVGPIPDDVETVDLRVKMSGSGLDAIEVVDDNYGV